MILLDSLWNPLGINESLAKKFKSVLPKKTWKKKRVKSVIRKNNPVAKK